MTIEVECDKCGKALKAPDSAIGKKAKCPACGTILIVQKPLEVIDDDELPRSAPPPPPPPKIDDPYGLGKLLDDEVAYQLQKPVPPPPPPSEPDGRRACPACGEMISVGAAKCRFCGEIFDHKRVKQAMKKARKSEPKAYYGDDDDLSGTDVLIAVFCGLIACFMGIMWVVQGKSKGWKMLALIFLLNLLGFALGFFKAYLDLKSAR